MMRLTTYTLAIILVIINSLGAQPAKYSMPANFNDIHTIYTYQKSNWDGSHLSTIYLFVADSNKLESFKWSAGDEVATLVTAWVDWKQFSVARFENHRLSRSEDPKLVAVLEQKGNQIKFDVFGIKDSMVLDDTHWQSYDFDFAGLGFTWRALRNKEEGFSFHIADADQKSSTPRFINKGKVFVKFIGKEFANGKSCLKYELNGPGLENKGGTIWIDPSSYMIELYKIELPDEPGFQNGMLKLISKEKKTPTEWKEFIGRKMKP